jgi:hypothetical protein
MREHQKGNDTGHRIEGFSGACCDWLERHRVQQLPFGNSVSHVSGTFGIA